MKRLLTSLCISLALITAPVVIPVAFNGCVSTKELPSVSAETANQVILHAEQTAEAAKLSFKTFVHLERENEALLKKINPQIHVQAENIRAHGIDWIVALRNATKTFEANRTADSRANLNTLLTTLISVVSDTNKYIAASKKAIAL